jgi:hypothetical protein
VISFTSAIIFGKEGPRKLFSCVFLFCFSVLLGLIVVSILQLYSCNPNYYARKNQAEKTKLLRLFVELFAQNQKLVEVKM